MQPARRSALRASRTLERSSKRGYSSHGEQHAGEEHASTTESFGPRFFLALTALPVGWALYDYSTSDSKNPAWLTRQLQSYDSWGAEWQRRNDLHQRAVQQAADDKLLFRSAGATKMVDLKFPEQFNSGSPFNNVAGRSVDLTELVQHYHKKNEEMEQRVASKTQEQRDKYL